jgi:hypothetical protein
MHRNGHGMCNGLAGVTRGRIPFSNSGFGREGGVVLEGMSHRKQILPIPIFAE